MPSCANGSCSFGLFCVCDQVNVVKGLKVYEDMFTDSELLRLSEFINELLLAGHRGELSGP